jgi:hypothetical protein
MLQRLIHSARVNVFESARFYYWVLVVLTSYFLLNRFLQKLSFVYLNNRWIELKVGEGILFGLAYVVILISAWFLRKKIPRYVFWCWGGLVLIFLINEFRFAWGNPDYSLIESLAKTQGYYTAKFTMPLLFWGVWSGLKNANHYGLIFVNQLCAFLTINAIFIVSGAVFDVSLFESYPLTGRWGYSGLLFHNSINSIFYGIGLIFILEKQKKEWLPIFLFSLALLLLGQKAGMFYLALIVCFAWIKNKTLHVGFLGVGGLLLLTVQYWIPFIVQYNLFWRNVYEKHGAWSVFFSLRNENIQNIFSQMNNISVLDIIIGGTGRFPIRVEMMPFDVLVFFGVLGLFCFTLLIIKIIPNWKWSIPILVACFGGGIYEATLGMLLFLLTLELVKKDKHSYSP